MEHRLPSSTAVDSIATNPLKIDREAYYTRREAAGMIRRSEATVRRLEKQLGIGKKLGRNNYIKGADLIRALEG